MKLIKTLMLMTLLNLFNSISIGTSSTNYINEYSFVTIKPNTIQFNKENISKHSPEYVLAAIAYHECFNIDKLERRYVMEAVWNRVQDNFNNNGTSLEDQILAPKQFTGLFIYYTEQFKFDPNNPICLENLSMAIDIIQRNKRECPKRIYYWASKKIDSNTQHWRNIINKSIKLKYQIYA